LKRVQIFVYFCEILKKNKNFGLMREGKIVQIIGPVIDIEFEDGYLPAIYNAIKIPRVNIEGKEEILWAEVQQHLGENRVRAVALDSTDGLVRGMKAYDTKVRLKFRLVPKFWDGF